MPLTTAVTEAWYRSLTINKSTDSTVYKNKHTLFSLLFFIMCIGLSQALLDVKGVSCFAFFLSFFCSNLAPWVLHDRVDSEAISKTSTWGAQQGLNENHHGQPWGSLKFEHKLCNGGRLPGTFLFVIRNLAYAIMCSRMPCSLPRQQRAVHVAYGPSTFFF